jgi:hypothetical protein
VARELSLDEIKAGLARLKYFTTARVETAIFLAVRLGKPLLAEGPAGAGKTEIGKVLASLLDTELVRLQCYEGLDAGAARSTSGTTRSQLLAHPVRPGRGQPTRLGAGVGAHLLRATTCSKRPLLRGDHASRAAWCC